MALYLIIQAGAFLSRVMPRSWRYLVGAAVGDAVWLAWARKRAVTNQNVSIILGARPGDPAVRQIAVKSLRNYCKYLIEFLELPVMSSTDERIASMKIHGLEYLQSALAGGKGVILASAHFGALEVPGLRLKDFTDFHAVYEPFRPAYLDRLIQRKRLEKGINLIAVSNVRAMLRVLHGGGTLALLYDRPVEAAKGVPVRFFGLDTAVPGGPAVLAMKTGATLIPVFTTREPDNTFSTILHPPISWTTTDDRECDVQTIMQKLMNVLQQAVMRRPDQWYMFRPMWPEALTSVTAASPEAARGGPSA